MTAFEIINAIRKLSDICINDYEDFLAMETLATLNHKPEDKVSLTDLFTLIIGAANDGLEKVSEGAWR